MEIELESYIHIPLDIRVINNAPISFVYNILKNNILIINKNDLIRTDFTVLIYKKYSDYQFMRNNYLRGI